MDARSEGAARLTEQQAARASRSRRAQELVLELTPDLTDDPGRPDSLAVEAVLLAWSETRIDPTPQTIRAHVAARRAALGLGGDAA